jgi:hypothetical protein
MNCFLKNVASFLAIETKKQFCNIRSQRKHLATLNGYVIYILAIMDPYKKMNTNIIRRYDIYINL